MIIIEAHEQEKRPRIVLRSLKKLPSQVFHVRDVASTLEKTTVVFSVGEIKWINLNKAEQESLLLHIQVTTYNYSIIYWDENLLRVHVLYT